MNELHEDSSNILMLCSWEETSSHRFGTTQGYVNNDRTFSFWLRTRTYLWATKTVPEEENACSGGFDGHQGFVKAVILLFDKRNELSLILLSLHGVTSKSRAGGLREA